MTQLLGPELFELDCVLLSLIARSGLIEQAITQVYTSHQFKAFKLIGLLIKITANN